MRIVLIIILDWDGTLVDSAGHIINSLVQAASEQGLVPPPDEAVRQIIGLGLPEAIRELYPEIDQAGVAALAQGYSAAYRASGTSLPPLFPGVLSTLEALSEHGCLLAVATGKSRRGLDRELSLRDMGRYFHATRCADETFSKPHPRMVEEILAVSCESPDQAVMVADTVFDMDMADSAGIRKVAVSYGAHPQHRLQACRPDLLVEDFSTILDWVIEQSWSSLEGESG